MYLRDFILFYYKKEIKKKIIFFSYEIVILVSLKGTYPQKLKWHIPLKS